MKEVFDNQLRFKVTARRFGNSVQFEVEAVDIKDALQKAMAHAARVFDYTAGEAGAPVVSVRPIVDDEDPMAKKTK